MKNSTPKPERNLNSLAVFCSSAAVLLLMPLLGCGADKKPDANTAQQQKGQTSENGNSGGAPCDYDGVTYQSGDTFPSSDGCNTCACSDGRVICTLRACADPQWFYTCGDPVCGLGHRPDPNLRDCDTEQAGDPCSPIGDRCDPYDDCNARLVCATSDPRMQPGGCPISRAEYKRDIHYLDGKELESYANQLMKMRLATYRYRAAGPAGAEQLGFIINDVGRSVSVNPDQETVNLYGYTSMAVAALKTQAEHIERLEQEVTELKSRLDAVTKSAASARKTARPQAAK